MLGSVNVSSQVVKGFSTNTPTMTSPHVPWTTPNQAVVDGGRTPPYWNPVWTGILSTTMVAFMVCAILGNTMVILVIGRHRGMRTRTNMFLCNLAIADLLTAILLMPVALVTVIRGEWVFGDVFCQINGFFMPLFFVASIHTLMYISVHKYITITRPFSRSMSRRKILLVIGAAWFWAMLTGYVTVHGLNTVLYKPATTQCGPKYPNSLRTYLHPIYISLTCYLVPFVIMTFCYARIFREMRAHSTRMEATSNLEKDLLFRQQRRITGTLIVVLVVFVVSWTPYILYSFYVSGLKDKDSVPTNLNAISYWFGYMNSACNPIIYALRSKAFRDGYKQLWCQVSRGPISEDNPADSLYAKLIQKLFPTEPTDQHSTLHRLQVFIQNSLRLPRPSTNSSSIGYNPEYPGSRKVSAGSIANFLVRPRHRKVSTSSMPESFRYTTASLPRLSRGKHTSFAVPARRSDLLLVSHADAPHRASAAAAGNTALGNGVLKEGAEGISTTGQNGQTPTKLVGHGNGKIHSHEEKRELLGDEFVSPDKPLITEREEDHMFVVVAYVEQNDQIQPSTTAPLIRVNPQTDRDTLQPLDIKNKFQSSKSVSVSEPKEKMSEASAQLNRCSSDTNVHTTSSPGIFRSILRSIHGKSRDGLRSTNSSPGRRLKTKDLEEGSMVGKGPSLTIPTWRTVLRSLSSGDSRGQNEVGTGGLHKASSDTHVLDADHKDSGRWWRKKLRSSDKLHQSEGNYRDGSITQSEEERARLQRTWSEKPRLLRTLSVEKLDAHAKRRSRSFTPTRKFRKKRASKKAKENSQNLVLTPERPSSPNVEVEMASVLLMKPGSQSMKDRSSSCPLDNEEGTLRRAWSDPCMTFQLLEDKVTVRRQLRRQRKNLGKSVYYRGHGSPT